jgi:hypothetical protein
VLDSTYPVPEQIAWQRAEGLERGLEDRLLHHPLYSSGGASRFGPRTARDAGSGRQLADGDIDKNSNLTAKGFDTDQAFMAVEISGDRMYFNAISRLGPIVDSGIIERRVPLEPPSFRSAFGPPVIPYG